MIVQEVLESREHGVLLVRGPRARLAGALGALPSREGLLCGPAELTSAEAYAEALVAGASAALPGGAEIGPELEAVARGLEWDARLRCALGLVRDALPRRRPPLRLVCVCCPERVADDAEQGRLVRALVEHTPELPWFYGIRLVLYAPASVQVPTRPPFVRVRGLFLDWTRVEPGRAAEGRSRWIR